MEKNHIQGKCGSSIRLGLFHGNKLVSVMTFGELRKSLGHSTIDNYYELIRYCSDLNCQVIGGASKLLSHFIKNNENVKKIITYADKRFSSIDNNIYQKLNFKHIGDSVPSYWYFKLGEIVRHHRYKFAKHKLRDRLKSFDSNLTEWQNMQMNGYDRIWDCGNLKYELIL